MQNKLLGLEEVYKLYRRYTAMAAAETVSPQAKSAIAIAQKLGVKVQTSGDLREQLEQQLSRHGVASIAEFVSYLSRFEQAFEEGAARITLDLLGKYAGKLYKESQRYQDPAIVKELHGKLGGFRAQHQAFAENATIWNDHAAQARRQGEQGRLPGNGHVRAQPPTPQQAQAGEKARAAKASAEASIEDLSKEYPIFAEDELPVDKRLDKVKLAQASESELGGVLQAHLADRMSVVVEARGQLEGKPELVYKVSDGTRGDHERVGKGDGHLLAW